MLFLFRNSNETSPSTLISFGHGNHLAMTLIINFKRYSMRTFFSSLGHLRPEIKLNSETKGVKYNHFPE